MTENTTQEILKPSDSDIRNAHLEQLQRLGELPALIRRANFTEIGLTGNVTQMELQIAKDENMTPPTEFELWLLNHWITIERQRRQDHLRNILTEMGDLSPDEIS